MKKKIVEYLAKEAQFALVEAESDANKLKIYNEMATPTEGGGLDLACLLEKLREAKKIIELLT